MQPYAMPALYFPACALAVQIVLCVVFLNRGASVRRNNVFFATMVLLGVLNSAIATMLACLLYVNYDQFISIGQWIGKANLAVYIIWATCFLLYVITIPSLKNTWFIKNRRKITVSLMGINVLVFLLIASWPLTIRSLEAVVFYEAGVASTMPLIVCTIYALLAVIRVIALRGSLTKQYSAVPSVFILLLLTAIIRISTPELALVPFMLALSNLIILLTFENPERKQLEQEQSINKKLEKLDHTKDQFLSIVSHQLRTPLTNVRGNSSMILDGDFGEVPETMRQPLKDIAISSNRMAYLIDDLLNVSRLQSGRFAINKAPVDFGALVLTQIEQIKSLPESRSVHIKCDEEALSKLPEMDMDGAKVGEVIANMLDNAMFYSSPKSTVRITVKRELSHIELRIKDAGIGVPKQEQQDIFAMFYRGSNAAAKRPDGTGVGLYLAKKIIDGHGGEIIFESEVGKGSVFGFRLPIK